MARRFTRAVRVAEVVGVVAAVAILAMLFLPRIASGGEAAEPAAEQPALNVAVVPAADSAGFFVALHQGLFAARGLHVSFIPAVSSETVINAQALDEPPTGSTSPAATTLAISRPRRTTTGASGPPRRTIPWSPPTWISSPRDR